MTRQKTFIQKLVLVMVMILGPMVVKAQTGGADAPADTSTTYLTPMEYAFMMHEEPKFMLRAKVMGIGAEVMLLPGITLMANFSLFEPYPERGTSAMGELRYYHQRNGRKSDHMSGNYFALGASIDPLHMSSGGSDVYTENNPFVYAKYGIQRRMFGNGLIDMGLLLGYNIGNLETHVRFQSPYLGVSTPASIGMGWVFSSKKDLDWIRLCPVTKCYEATKRMIKINTAGLFDLKHYTEGSGISVIHFTPKIGFEQKLFQGVFSINSIVRYSSAMFFQKGFSNSVTHEYGILAEGRWYYNLKRRMMQGKTGNGLSANYIAAGYSYLNEYRGFSDVHVHISRGQPYILTGIQRTLGDRFYFDVNLGYGQISESTELSEQILNRKYWGLIGDVQIGFKF